MTQGPPWQPLLFTVTVLLPTTCTYRVSSLVHATTDSAKAGIENIADKNTACVKTARFFIGSPFRLQSGLAGISLCSRAPLSIHPGGALPSGIQGVYKNGSA